MVVAETRWAIWLLLVVTTGCPGRANKGCENDNDCKGDRVCEARQCTYPRRPAPCPEPPPCPQQPPRHCPDCGASGSAGSTVGPAEQPPAGAPRVVAGRPEVRGALDREIIRRIIRRHIKEVMDCYRKGLTVNPDLVGRVVVQFTIAATGQVVASQIQSSTLQDPKVASCITAAVRRWLFPKPRGGIVIVSYPFVLKSVR